MCNFFSAIVTRQHKLLYNLNVDSHEYLVTLFDLRDDQQAYVRQNWVRIEFIPNLTQDITQQDSWMLRVDEKETPDWFDYDKVQAKCWDVISKIIITDYRKLLVDSVWILAGEGKVDCLIGNASVKYMTDFSQVGEMLDSSRVGEMYGSSQVGVMWDSSQVGKMWASSQVGEMGDFSQVEEMRDSSQVREMWASSRVGEMFSSSQVERMWAYSRIGKMFSFSRAPRKPEEDFR